MSLSQGLIKTSLGAYLSRPDAECKQKCRGQEPTRGHDLRRDVYWLGPVITCNEKHVSGRESKDSILIRGTLERGA